MSQENTSRIKKPNHLIYRKSFWMVYTAFSYAAIIFGGLSTVFSALDIFDGFASTGTAHLLISVLFLISGLVFLDARIYWGRLLLYTRKQDRQNELVINAKDVDDYRQKEAERNRQQLQQMDKAIEAAVERKMGDFDERMELYTKQNAKMQKNSMNQYVDYLETRLKRFDASLDKIASMVTSKAQEKEERDNFRQRLTSVFRSAPVEEKNDDGILFDTEPADSAQPQNEATETEESPSDNPKETNSPVDTSGISMTPEDDGYYPEEDEYNESLYPEEEDLPNDLLSNG